MAQQTKHTPLQWVIDGNFIVGGVAPEKYTGLEGVVILNYAPITEYETPHILEQKANAKLICKAVNNHDKLVETMQGIIDYLEWSESFMVEDAEEGKDNAYKTAKELLQSLKD
mgnify:FL=1